jgi:hypothetical protein
LLGCARGWGRDRVRRAIGVSRGSRGEKGC